MNQMTLNLNRKISSSFRMPIMTKSFASSYTTFLRHFYSTLPSQQQQQQPLSSVITITITTIPSFGPLQRVGKPKSLTTN